MDIAKPMKLDEISAVVMIDFLGVPRLICFCGAWFQVICQRDLHVCQHATTVEDGNSGRVLDAGLSDQQPGQPCFFFFMADAYTHSTSRSAEIKLAISTTFGYGLIWR